MKHSLTIPLAICIGGIIVAGAVYLTVKSHGPSTSSGSGNPTLVRPVDSTDHILGNPLAPVKIIEYSDFDCTYCKTFDATLHQLIALKGAEGQVAWVYRHFPLTQLHPNALMHAEAAECVAKVGGNDAFWKFADSLFANQPTDPSRYGAIAQSAGITSADFATCYANAATTVLPRIEADSKNATDTGARGTPYSLIVVDGKAPIVVDGAYDIENLSNLIDQALKSAAVIPTR